MKRRRDERESQGRQRNFHHELSGFGINRGARRGRRKILLCVLCVLGGFRSLGYQRLPVDVMALESLIG